MNGCGLLFVVFLCIILFGFELLSNWFYKLGGFCLVFCCNGYEKYCFIFVVGDIV